MNHENVEKVSRKSKRQMFPNNQKGMTTCEEDLAVADRVLAAWEAKEMTQLQPQDLAWALANVAEVAANLTRTRARAVLDASTEDSLAQLDAMLRRSDDTRMRFERELTSRRGGAASFGALMYLEEPASEKVWTSRPKVTYWNYIQPTALIERLSLYSDHHDERLFVRVHQCFELWFDQVLHELGEVMRRLGTSPACPAASEGAAAAAAPSPAADPLDAANLQKVVHYLTRADVIVRHATSAFEILETLEPGDFIDFRDALGDASGFQSTQYRELEIALGQTRRPQLGKHSWQDKFSEQGCPFADMSRVCKRLGSPTLRGVLKDWLLALKVPNVAAFTEHVLQIKTGSQNPDASDAESPKRFFFELYDGTDDLLACPMSYTRDQTDLTMRQTALFVLTWKDHPRWHLAARVLDRVMHFEQSFVLWRQRHARMVEYEIGRRTGTGGSSGVAFLDQTANPQYRVFHDLVRIRGEAISHLKLRPLTADGSWQ